MGVDTILLQQEKRAFARACLDWSERRHHLAGALGASLLAAMVSQHWLRKTKNARAIIVTGKGQTALYTHFKIKV
jgi:hypothetical protein